MRAGRRTARRCAARSCILHGRTEFIEKYFETINDLRRRGFAVATFDSRGQGGSGRLLGNPRKGHVRDFADHVNDFETVMQEVVLPDCPPPYYVLGAFDRRGGGAALGGAAAHADRPHGADGAASRAVVRLAETAVAQFTGFLMHFGLGEAFAPGAGATLDADAALLGQSADQRPRALSAHARGRRRPTRRSASAARRSAGSMPRCAPAAGSPSRISPTTVPMPVLIVLGGRGQRRQQPGGGELLRAA